MCVRRRVLIAGLGAGRSYTFVVHAENGVSDQSSNDAVRRRRITVWTQPAGARDRPSAVLNACWRESAKPIVFNCNTLLERRNDSFKEMSFMYNM